MAKTIKTPNEMSFLDHLEELRWHLIRSTLAIVIIGGVAFLMKGFIFDTVIFGPMMPDFPTYHVFCDFSKLLGFSEAFCNTEPNLRYRVGKCPNNSLHTSGLPFGQVL